MISTTYGGRSVFILPYPPQWVDDVEVTIEKLTYDSAGLSNREEREELASKLRFGMKYTAYLTYLESPVLQAAIDAWDNRPILVPFWPAERLASGSAAPSVTGGLTIFYEPTSTGWGNYEITTGGAPGTFTPTASCKRAPLMWGRFEGSLPAVTILTATDEESATFELVENGIPSTALDAKTVTLTVGATVNSGTPPILTVPYVWGENSVQGDVRVNRKKIGFGRDDADTYYPQVVRQRATLNFEVMNTAETSYLLYLFKTQAGSVNPWWLPHPRLIGSYIYGRFYSDKITLTWSRSGAFDEIVSAQIEFMTLPTEQTVPSGEVFGSNIGPTSARFFLYETTDGSSYWRYTSYESTIVGPASNSYTHQSMTHGSINEELNLQTHDCTLDIQHWAGGVFARLLQNPMADPLTVTIYEGFIANPTAAVAIFTGRATAPKIVGQQLQVSLIGPGAAILSSQGPRSILQKGCNAIVFDSRCGLSRGTFSLTRTLVSVSGAIATLSAGAALPVNGYFQNGYAERVVGGVTQRFMIHDSYTTAGNITLVLVGLCIGSTGGESWILVPGCDGTYATCVSRFSNGVNHRGCPNMPDINPSMFIINKASGTKKS
jgi:uncharacterized phage protein (TIGR02218 family)